MNMGLYWFAFCMMLFATGLNTWSAVRNIRARKGIIQCLQNMEELQQKLEDNLLELERESEELRKRY